MTKIYCKTLDKWCDSMGDAALVAGVNKAHFAIVMRAKGRFKSKDGLEFSFKNEAGNTYAREHAMQNINKITNLGMHTTEEIAKPRGKQAISITCLQTGEVFASAKFVAAKTKYSTGYIGQCLKKHGQFKFDGCTYVYTHSISPKTTSDGTVVICKETGDRFISLDLFCKYLMVNKETVSNIFKNNGKYVTKDGKVFVLEKVTNTTPEQKVEKPKVEVDSSVKPHAEEKVEKMSVVKMIEKMHEVREKAYNEQEALNQALVSFINKGMYSEASVLCDSLQKIYLKK